MKKSTTYMFVSIIGIFLTILACVGLFASSKEAENYRQKVADHFGVSTVFFRENTRSEPLWLGEPQGAYVYNGYVGYGMTDEDRDNIEILATGHEAEVMVDEFSRLSDEGNIWFLPLLVGIITFFACLALGIDQRRIEQFAPEQAPSSEITRSSPSITMTRYR